MSSEHPAIARIPATFKAKISPRAIRTIIKVHEWVEQECIPAEGLMERQLEGQRWTVQPKMKELRERAKAAGLFNLFLPKTFKESPGLSNLEYACCAEIMGRCFWAAETMNCHAPETGNIELLAKYCKPKQKEKWLQPLLDGTAMSAYSMTEPDVAASDATKIACRMHRDGDEYVINGRKVFGGSLMNKSLSFYILMVCSDASNSNPWRRHSMVIVPTDTPGLRLIRNLTIMGYDDAPQGHAEFEYTNVRIPVENLILGEGKAFEIAQGRLGPGRIHHCMRLIGQSERAYEMALVRALDPRKKPRGKLIGEFDSNIERLAQMRLDIDTMRLIVLNAAETMDLKGNKAGRRAIAHSKITVPNMAASVIDEAMQMHGGLGLTQDTFMPHAWTYARYVRLADGPDAAHRHQVGREELKSAVGLREKHEVYLRRSLELTAKL
ncbi:uncharacterized protein A1O9_06924 [Exophiala aquamarina CBS 119918]|uniref:Acyl-CoA dehydrogenase n=1 Tax=Exophiala aquamarina CBS 119918 TaxID=1182545 RepID=A0A072P9F1_9EURO|nr:uncharacterized protein A1O9_06924 [Exophiala aquamarina CBS 119918]KEF56734.1 hypothetical protein A1O9_06924 [Exophiala aquamarina CBS 119918]